MDYHAPTLVCASPLGVKSKHTGLEEKWVAVNSLPHLARAKLVDVPSSLDETAVQKSGVRGSQPDCKVTRKLS